MILRALMHENPNNNNVLKALKKKKKSVHVSALVCLKKKKGIEKGQCNPPKKREKKQTTKWKYALFDQPLSDLLHLVTFGHEQSLGVVKSYEPSAYVYIQ